jgi:hypothetical protein
MFTLHGSLATLIPKSIIVTSSCIMLYALQGCAFLVPTYWVTRSSHITQMEYRENVPANSTIHNFA